MDPKKYAHRTTLAKIRVSTARSSKSWRTDQSESHGVGGSNPRRRTPEEPSPAHQESDASQRSHHSQRLQTRHRKEVERSREEKHTNPPADHRTSGNTGTCRQRQQGERVKKVIKSRRFPGGSGAEVAEPRFEPMGTKSPQGHGEEGQSRCEANNGGSLHSPSLAANPSDAKACLIDLLKKTGLSVGAWIRESRTDMRVLSHSSELNAQSRRVCAAAEAYIAPG